MMTNKSLNDQLLSSTTASEDASSYHHHHHVPSMATTASSGTHSTASTSIDFPSGSGGGGGTNPNISWSMPMPIPPPLLNPDPLRPPSRIDRRKSSNAANGNGGDKLRTFQGVFLPCLSQILGVIFFLRLPTITGQAGTTGASLIILVCVLSTFVTSLSLSAIASNGTIQAGGPYYVISRTLGVEVGGSLGLLFYLGTALGGAMYVMGAVEVLQTNIAEYGDNSGNSAYGNYDNNAAANYNNNHKYPGSGWFGRTQVYSLILMTLLTTLVAVGVKYVNMSATFFLLAVTVSIASILLGTVLFSADVYDGSLTDDQRIFMDNLWPNYEPDPKTGVTPTFYSLMALFYPSVTGIMAGTNRSAKLATPNESIPVGTIGAILVTSLLYLFQVWLLGSVVSHDTLLENKLVLACIAYPSRIVVKVGIITSCIGAALQCMAGAPQLLEAIAVDGAIPFLKFVQPADVEEDEDHYPDDGNGNAKKGGGEPTRAIWVTWFIASLATLAGNLDHITPILTMFFLLMYGGINLCCFLLAWVRAPGFRPTFKYFHRSVSLFGFIWCLGMAFCISWMFALLSIGLFGLNYRYISSRKSTNVTVAIAEKDLEITNGDGGGGASSSNPTSGSGINGFHPQQMIHTVGTNWGDVGDSLRYKLTTAVLMKVTGTENFHAKNWRPQLITFVDTDDEGNPTSMEVLALAAQLKKGRGLNVVVSIRQQESSLVQSSRIYERSQELRSVLKEHMDNEGIAGFAEVAVTSGCPYSEAVWSAVIHSGLGPVSPNIALFSWMGDWRSRMDRTKEVVEAIRGLTNMKRAVALFKGSRSFPRHGDVVPQGMIDIYWVVDDGGLCLLLPYLISKNRIWRRSVRLRVFAVTTSSREDPELLEAAVVDHLSCVRIQAAVRVIDMSGTTLGRDMRERSSAPRMTLGELFPQVVDVSGKALYNHDSTESSLGSSGTSVAANARRRSSMPNFQQDGADGEGDILESQLGTAKFFNNTMRHHSKGANLVVTNLPRIQRMKEPAEFMEYTEAMCSNIDNMLLVRGSGATVITAIA